MPAEISIASGAGRSRIVMMRRHGGPEVLEIEQQDVALPQPGYVRMRVRAIGLNRSDVNVRVGTFALRPLPCSLGFEAAGLIDALGDDVTGLAVGDRVAVIPLAKAGFTTYGEHILVPASLVAKIPPPLDFAEAAALWASALTAYGPLVGHGVIEPGDHVVVTAASSSVGTAALQILRRLDAVPIAVTRDATKAAALRYLDEGEAAAIAAVEDVKGAVFNSKDFHEGIMSFIERRDANFQGE